MSYSNAYQQITQWLEAGNGASSNGVLDNKGCCQISRGGEDEAIVMLPPNEPTLYLIASLYQPEVETDSDLLAFCLGLNAYSMVSMKMAAVGLDTHGRQLILRSAHSIEESVAYDFDSILSGFLEQATSIRQLIQQFLYSRRSEGLDAFENYDLEMGVSSAVRA